MICCQHQYEIMKLMINVSLADRGLEGVLGLHPLLSKNVMKQGNKMHVHFSNLNKQEFIINFHRNPPSPGRAAVF